MTDHHDNIQDLAAKLKAAEIVLFEQAEELGCYDKLIQSILDYVGETKDVLDAIIATIEASEKKSHL